ncbi:hypothetical protein [Synechococcus phage Yong-L2-223]|nr:hypothetical protein [Synechococcus phage Yong-L2-223]
MLQIISALPYIGATVAIAVLYNVIWDNPRVAREARQGYVLEVEVAALEAERNELQRQRDAARRSAAAWQDQLERFQEAFDEKQTELEQQITEYEQANLDRRCELSPSDLDFLR